MDGVVVDPPYVFGTAFNVMYLSNPAVFGVKFLATMNPPALEPNGALPMALVSDGNNEMIAFVFTLNQNQEFTMLEGGFTDGVEPSSAELIPVTPVSVRRYCWKYNPEQCQGYNDQAGTNYSCPDRNLDITVTKFMSATGVTLNPAFRDSISNGMCLGQNEQDTGKCMDEILYGLRHGDLMRIIDGVECLAGVLDVSITDAMKMLDDKFHIKVET